MSTVAPGSTLEMRWEIWTMSSVPVTWYSAATPMRKERSHQVDHGEHERARISG